MDDRRIISILEEREDNISEYSEDELSLIEEHLSIDRRYRIRSGLLGLVLHYSPKQAILKQKQDQDIPGPYDEELEPYEMIQNHLHKEFNIEEELAKKGGIYLGRVLDSWYSEGRLSRNVSTIRASLKRKQGDRCANCRVLLDNEDKSVAFQNEDEFKPIHLFSEQQTSSELDHIEPISQFGGNTASNHQVICKFCNKVKGNQKHMPIINKQLEPAIKEINEIKKDFRRQNVLYSYI